MALLRLLMLLGCLLPGLTSGETLKVQSGISSVDLNPHLRIYIDQSKSQSIESILKLPETVFQPLEKHSLGFVDKPIWLKIKLDLSSASPETWVLYDNWFSHDNISLYYVHQGQLQTLGSNGILQGTQSYFESRKLNF